jgi:hypothetical protein
MIHLQHCMKYRNDYKKTNASMLREQLRQLIQNRVPAEQLQQHLDKINDNLDRAKQLLGVMP